MAISAEAPLCTKYRSEMMAVVGKYTWLSASVTRKRPRPS